MEISGKQTTKSSDSRRKEINKVIWYTVARKQQSHMISGGKSTKSFDMCLKSMTLFLLAPHPTFRRPPKRPIAANKRTLDVATVGAYKSAKSTNYLWIPPRATGVAFAFVAKPKHPLSGQRQASNQCNSQFVAIN